MTPTLSLYLRKVIVCTLVSVGVFGLSGPARGQTEEQPAERSPAHLAFIEGSATLERENRVEPAVTNLLLLPGDRLKTTIGRIEALFPAGTTLHLDQHTTLDVLSETRLRLLEGRILLYVGTADVAVSYQLDTPLGTVHTHAAGDYRVSLLTGTRSPQIELAVIRGLAELVTDAGSVSARTGERSIAHGDGAPLFPQVFNSARWDAFDLWSQRRRGERSYAGASYLPSTLQPYAADLNRYGQWQSDVTYGYVWYPTVVSTWQPYFHGVWRHYPQFGWTWIGFDGWAWPTHHFGRWGRSHRGWFWVPSLRWGPAWVHWAFSPRYVSWCPLDPLGRPIGGSFWRGHEAGWWTMAPRRVLDFGDRVDRTAVDVRSFSARTRASFVPAGLPQFAVPRDLYRAPGRPVPFVTRQGPLRPNGWPDHRFEGAVRTPNPDAPTLEERSGAGPRGPRQRSEIMSGVQGSPRVIEERSGTEPTGLRRGVIDGRERRPPSSVPLNTLPEDIRAVPRHPGLPTIDRQGVGSVDRQPDSGETQHPYLGGGRLQPRPRGAPADPPSERAAPPERTRPSSPPIGVAVPRGDSSPPQPGPDPGDASPRAMPSSPPGPPDGTAVPRGGIGRPSPPSGAPSSRGTTSPPSRGGSIGSRSGRGR